MRVALKECEWETIGDDLLVVFDAREAITLDDPEGTWPRSSPSCAGPRRPRPS
ncbi:hypothetical protein ACFQ0B_43670 [Nonomuraea thailandensis]